MVRDKYKKRDDDDEDDFYYKPLNTNQLRELHLEVLQAGGRTKFLQKLGIVSIDEHGIMSVRMVPGMKGTGLRDGWDIHYQSEIPYETWSRVMNDLEKYEYGLEQQKMRENPQYREEVIARTRIALSELLGKKLSV